MKTPSPLPTTLLFLLSATLLPPPSNASSSLSGPQETSCPKIHIFGARETTAPQGFGTAQTLIDLLLHTFSFSSPKNPVAITAEEIIYPAGGGDSYGASVAGGIEAVVRQTETFVARCPESVLVLHGYSQGAQIMDDALCGLGGDVPAGDFLHELNESTVVVSLPGAGRFSKGDGEGEEGQQQQQEEEEDVVVVLPRLVSDKVAANIAAVIFMGNPRHVDGLPFNVGNATVGGVS